jgi:hypothetical protein
VSGKKVQRHSLNISRVLANITIEQGSEIDWFNRFNNLRNERLLCSLTEVKGELELTPYIFGSFKLRSGAVSRWSKWAWIRRTNPRDGICQGSISVDGQNESKVAVLAASKCGGDRSSISFDFGHKGLKSLIDGLAMDSCQHLVLKVSVFDIWGTG